MQKRYHATEAKFTSFKQLSALSFQNVVDRLTAPFNVSYTAWLFFIFTLTMELHIESSVNS